MKKIALVIVILSLILSTAIIKNSAKKNEDKIFTVKENIRVLKFRVWEDKVRIWLPELFWQIIRVSIIIFWKWFNTKKNWKYKSL